MGLIQLQEKKTRENNSLDRWMLFLVLEMHRSRT